MVIDGQFLVAFGASLLAGGVTTAGILAVRRFEAWAKENSSYFAAYAAGVLITVSFLHLIPKSLNLSAQAPVCLLAGYLALHLFNRFVATHVCDRPDTADYAIGLVPMLGIGLHSFIDGMIYSVTYSVGVATGVISTFGMVLHEFPEGIITYVLLIRGGFSERTAFWLALGAAALTTPLGTLLSWPFIREADASGLGVLLSLSAGALVYVGATHLLPHAEHKQLPYSLLVLAVGIATAIGIVVSVG